MTWFWTPLPQAPPLNGQARQVGSCPATTWVWQSRPEARRRTGQSAAGGGGPAGHEVAHELNDGPSSSQMTWFWTPLPQVPQLNEQSRLVA